MTVRELPIAPRPQDDELLSSWQGRVACRYGLFPDELSRWLGVVNDGRCAGFAVRDFAPGPAVVRTWAAACRLSADRVRSLALASRRRSLSWYVWGEGSGAFQRPVCLACLDDDAAAGRDHHVRRSWALVETLACDRHHRLLEEACPHCLGGSGFRFVCSGAAARLACLPCGRMVGAARQWRRGGAGDPFSTVSTSIAKAIADQPSITERMLAVARLLWRRPRQRSGRRTPFVADVLPDLRLPPSVAMRVDRAEPLATAPIGWRMVTLLGIATLLDLDGLKSLRRLTFTIEQVLDWTTEPPPPATELRPPLAVSARGPGRSDADYLALARSILESDDWRAVQGRDKRTQARTLNALIGKALAGGADHLHRGLRISPRPSPAAPRGPAGAPDRAAISRRRRPIDGRRAACARACARAERRCRAG
jgi:hypothetical protein